MKTYEAYKESGIDWMGVIPTDWDLLKIGRTFSNIGSGTTPKSTDRKYYDNGEINWLNTGDLNDDFIYSTKKKITHYATENNSTLRLHPKNSVVIALYGATIGKLGYLKIECTTNQACCVLSNADKVTQRFLFYYFLGAREFIISKSYGGGQPNISQELIKQLYIASPSLKEQTQIANYLDYNTQIIDTLIEKKEQLIKKIQAQRQAIINEAVTKGLNPNAKMKASGIEWLGEIPEHWQVVKLRFLADITTGSKDTENKEINGKFPFFVRSQTIEQISSYTFEGEAILTAGDGVGVCKVWHYINDKFDFHQRVYMMSNFKQVTGKYLFHFLKENFVHEVLKLSAKSTVDSLRRPMFLNFPVAVPPLKEQNKIVENVTNSIDLIDKSIIKITSQIKKLKSYRQSIISEAVTGKIDVRDWKPKTTQNV
ncbi:restriction endonuclease subunit S [Tenacibaculum ovolyticum]|uniref:restriction endonuclease subunit S n=1 Tax=Tenacibaculum ovolyticum TaxID=104270 RepID=UPI0022F396D6|nr:restriction endonuclease subunit S [Tenacibaculum ovolyticum]WBX78099.1 restriction endonuclease subunit S [Tenacibaculum ovolyticum]